MSGENLLGPAPTLLPEEPEVKAALARDPYYSAPGVSVVKIQPWTVVAGDL